MNTGQWQEPRRLTHANRRTTLRALSLAMLLVVCPVPRPAHAQRTGATELTVRPLLSLGGRAIVNGAPLQNVLAAVRVASGIAAYDGTLHRLLFFDAHGQLVRELRSRSGGEAGSFSRVTWMGRCSRALLYVVDPILQRMTVFDARGNYVRRFRLPPFTVQWSCSEDGTLATLLQPRLKPYRIWTRERGLAAILFLDSLGNVRRETHAMPVGEGLFGGRLTSLAMARQRLYVGTADSTFVDVFDMNAKQLKSVSVGRLHARRMTKRDYEIIVSRRLPHWPDSIKQQVLLAPRPTNHPLYRQLRATPEGTLWLVVSAESDDKTTLRVVRLRDGTMNEVQLPRATTILDVGDDFLVAEYKAANGTERVVLYAVESGP